MTITALTIAATTLTMMAVVKLLTGNDKRADDVCENDDSVTEAAIITTRATLTRAKNDGHYYDDDRIY